MKKTGVSGPWGAYEQPMSTTGSGEKPERNIDFVLQDQL